MPAYWPDKDPDEVLDYGFRIDGIDPSDSITLTDATVLTGSVEKVSHALVPGTTTSSTRLKGGTAGETAQIRIRTTLASGQVVDQTMLLPIVQR